MDRSDPTPSTSVIVRPAARGSDTDSQAVPTPRPTPIVPVGPGAAEVAGVPGYTLLGALGRGGMGVVYRARQKALNRIVALKTVHWSDTTDPVTLGRFWAEADAVAAIDHPHVVRVYEFGHHRGAPFLALELAKTLGERPSPGGTG